MPRKAKRKAKRPAPQPAEEEEADPEYVVVTKDDM
jgi:hypothetical protein